ncbi:MAG: helix-turn-helix domain-containing protein [Burkholderiaceae bacterium]
MSRLRMPRAVVRLHCVTESGASAETSAVGREGVVGAPVFLGGASTSSSAVVSRAGMAYRLSQQATKLEFNRAGSLRRLLLLHTRSTIMQTAQAAGCNRHHSMSQILSRWLLSTLDRSAEGELAMTQELLGGILGVRREGITEAAGRLQNAGFIRYRRGHILVTDRAGLETRACECYGAMKREIGGLFA